MLERLTHALLNKVRGLLMKLLKMIVENLISLLLVKELLLKMQLLTKSFIFLANILKNTQFTILLLTVNIMQLTCLI